MALFVSTLGMLMATIDSTITLIALPDIFRGINIDPIDPGNSFFLLWMLLGFSVITAVLTTTFGRLGDIYGRVRIYNLGFALFTFFSLLLTVTWMSGRAAAIFLIVLRLFQAAGAAMLMSNSAAILTDAFPERQRGMAMGINQAAGFGGSFIGLALGGILAPVNWRLVFLVSVPIGLFASVLGYLKLRELGPRQHATIDWPGNISFAAGLILIMIGITYGIEPYGSSALGWTNPAVLACLAAGAALILLNAIIESRAAHPMIALRLFRIRAFSAGAFATLLASLARGGLMFILVIWLQGIWLPLHGVPFSLTPLRAGVAVVPLTLGFLVSGPLSGLLSDRFGARVFATLGMIGTAIAFALFEVLPTNFSYWVFSVLLFATGLVMAMFGSANRAAVMNSVPAADRGAGAGLNNTFQNAGQVVSTGLFFTLMTVGLSGALPAGLYQGLVAHGVPDATALHISHLPPVSTIFSAFLGYNPIQHLVGAHVLGQLSSAQQRILLGRSFFPSIISGPFRVGLHTALDFGIIASVLAAAASWVRGARQPEREPRPDGALAVPGSADDAVAGAGTIALGGTMGDVTGETELAGPAAEQDAELAGPAAEQDAELAGPAAELDAQPARRPRG
jgi:MFS family permease